MTLLNAESKINPKRLEWILLSRQWYKSYSSESAQSSESISRSGNLSYYLSFGRLMRCMLFLESV